MKIETLHPEYEQISDVWALTRAACAGEHVIKAGGDKYLPKFSPNDAKRYEQYLKRAYYMNATGRTRDALVGMIFRKPPTQNLPAAFDAITENIDGAGQSLEQISKEGAKNLLEVGRHIFLVDYPQVESGLDLEAETRLQLQPTIASYPAESLINWKYQGVNGKQKLTLAVLLEHKEVAKDEFSHETANVYRVLRLRDGVYTQQTYNHEGKPLTNEYAPRMAGGGTFDHIPLHIVGAQNNKPNVDIPPLYDMAIINIAHYQTTADHRENLFIHGQLTLGVVTDMSSQEFIEANPDGVKVGARTGHFLGANGNFVSVSAPESSSLRVALQDLEAQIVSIGGRLIQRGGQAETAEAARINASAEASTLDLLVNNLSEGLEACLEDCALFIGQNTEQIDFTLNTDFWETSLDPSMTMAIVALGDKGVIAKYDQRHMIRRGKIEIEEGRTDEDIDLDVASNIINGEDDI